MKEQIIFYSNMMKVMSSEDNNSVNFYFSHYNEGTDMVNFMKTIIEGLDANEVLNITLVSVLKKMRSLST